MKLYAFDVDETLEVSGGPVAMESVAELRRQGHIVGLCGNFAVVTRTFPRDWHGLFSFIGPAGLTKADFLLQLKHYVPCDEVVMVGNVFGVSGSSRDSEAAELAGVRFIQESDFAAGER